MAGCLKLCFWKKRSKTEPTAGRNEKSPPAHIETATRNPETRPLEAQRTRAAIPPAHSGVPIRPNVDPVYSAFSTPVDTRWADSATSTKTPNSLDDGARPKHEHAVDPEEVARRKKAEQEEQERLDFFQMM